MNTPIMLVLLVVTLIACGSSTATQSAAAPDCSRAAGSLAEPLDAPIDHVVIVMQENHSFDNYFGRLGNRVDGVTPDMFNVDELGKKHFVFHQTSKIVADVPHSWTDMHFFWHEGKNDRFPQRSDARVMGYYERGELPFYYEMADRFAIADRYFCSLLGPTFPNRYYLLTGTSFGHITNEFPDGDEYTQKNIFDALEARGISWKYYADWNGYIALFGRTFKKTMAKHGTIADYARDAREGKLPQVSFVESNFEKDEDEHCPSDISIGEMWTAARIRDLRNGPQWKRAALFLTYDENGGFFDHVPPPEACIPDDIAPVLEEGSYPAKFDRTGFRVPFIAVSPYAKRGYVSHVTYDHTSVLKFLERRFRLPALTRRDANAADLTDLFDFTHPIFD